LFSPRIHYSAGNKPEQLGTTAATSRFGARAI
jgi:hypothetical protein